MKIEKTFIISLPERFGDRLIPLVNHLNELDFNSHHTIQIYTAIKNKNGALGLLKTIEQLFTECLESGYSNILVLEDDVVFLKPDINSRIESLLSQLPEKYDCLFLGCNLWQNIVYKYSTNLIQLYDAYALQSVIYSRSGMYKILNSIKIMRRIIPLDILIQTNIMPDGNCYCAFPSLTSQINSYSDIEKKEVNYKHLLEDRFKEKTKHLQ